MPDQQSLGLPDFPGIGGGDWNLVELKEASEPSRQFTLERVPKEKIEAITRALGEGLGIRQTARALSVSVNTVLAVRKLRGADVETQKEQAANQFSNLRDLAVERMIEEIDLMPRQTLPIVAGVAAEKAELLRGAPTARVHHDHALRVESVADYIDSLPAAAPVAAGEEEGQKAVGGGCAPLPTAEPAANGLGENTRDSQSLGLVARSEEIGEIRVEDGKNAAQNGGAA